MSAQEQSCQALTKSGEQCKRKATSESGYCSIHDPERIAKREAASKVQESPPPPPPHKRFSQRKGFKPVSEIIQIEGMNDDLRISLWNVISSNVLDFYRPRTIFHVIIINEIDPFTLALWKNFFKTPIESIPFAREKILEYIFNWYKKCEWYEVYDFVEYIVLFESSSQLVEEINKVLERELSGYRVVGNVVTDITDEQEIEMLEDALTNDDFPSVREHLRRALALMSARENPDYRNSIKESISAVESMAKAITGNPKTTLGDALLVLEKNGAIHPALKQALTKLYGYTSDEEGIRHAMLNEPSLTASDAKFFLMVCTSFTNYLKAKI